MSARSLFIIGINRRRAFSLLEVVVAVGIFAFAVIAIIGLLLPNTSAVQERIESDTARRLTENIQSELQRYLRATSETQNLPGKRLTGGSVSRESGVRMSRSGKCLQIAKL